ncbi:fimbrial protein [Citrobacter europaeus]|uniref:fimbrial protein n=2 Tax=Citrobacter TaxID=544 RepID=UPI003978D8AF
MTRNTLIMLMLLIAPLRAVWAAGCTFMIGNTSDQNATIDADINIAASGQSYLPSTTDVLVKTNSTGISYWGKNETNQSHKVIFTRVDNVSYPMDTNNNKGSLVDKSIPGLYFTLSADLTAPQGYWNGWEKMPIYMSSDSSINQTNPASVWGCANNRNAEFLMNATATFKLTFYTTAEFDPALAAGKQVFTSRQKVGEVANSTGAGGQIDVYLTGPVTITTAGCGAFKADEVVSLGETTVENLYALPTVNQTPFSIKLQNCYGNPSLVINVSSNQVKNNLLVNTSGSAKGVGVGLTYFQTKSGADFAYEMDLTKAVTLDSSYLNYDSSGNGTLNMAAHLAIIERSALTGGTVNIPTVITLTHP